MASFLLVYLLRESGKAKFIWKYLINLDFNEKESNSKLSGKFSFKSFQF
jgi:hypothetical protein